MLIRVPCHPLDQRVVESAVRLIRRGKLKVEDGRQTIRSNERLSVTVANGGHCLASSSWAVHQCDRLMNASIVTGDRKILELFRFDKRQQIKTVEGHEDAPL